MSDKPLDATGVTGAVGKHDFVGRVVDGIHFNKSGRAFGRIEVERLIAAAVAEERVACADLADPSRWEGWNGPAEHVAQTIQTAILARRLATPSGPDSASTPDLGAPGC